MREKLPMSSLVTTRGNTWAFTYHFRGNAIEGTGTGGVINIVMIECPDTPKVSSGASFLMKMAFFVDINMET